MTPAAFGRFYQPSDRSALNEKNFEQFSEKNEKKRALIDSGFAGLSASSALDRELLSWNFSSIPCLSTLKGHSFPVNALAVLPNGSLASSSNDYTIKLWDPTIASLSTRHLLPILQALKTNTSVTELNLSGNPQITNDIIDPLINLFTAITSSDSKPNTTLKTIDLRKTGVTQKEVNKFQKTIRAQSLSIDIFSDGDVRWGMIAFLLAFSRANRNNIIVDSGLDICVGGEFGRFLDIPSKWFVRSKSTNDAVQVKNHIHSPS